MLQKFFAATVVVGLFLARGGKTLMYGLADVLYLEIVLLRSVMITFLACTVTLLPQNTTSKGTELPPPRDSRVYTTRHCIMCSCAMHKNCAAPGLVKRGRSPALGYLRNLPQTIRHLQQTPSTYRCLTDVLFTG